MLWLSKKGAGHKHLLAPGRCGMLHQPLDAEGCTLGDAPSDAAQCAIASWCWACPTLPSSLVAFPGIVFLSWLDTTRVTDFQGILRGSAEGLCPEIISVAGSCSARRSRKTVGEAGAADHTCALLFAVFWHGQGTWGT